jgi:hypothetical protein
MKKSVLNLLIFVLALVSIPYMILFLMYIYVNVFETITPQYSPKERNYLTFPNGNTDEIIDSLNSFKRMVKSMDLPKDADLNATWFNYFNNNLKITNVEIGNISFLRFRHAKCFKHLNDNEIHNFINIFKFLFNQHIKPGMYYYELDKMDYEYKKYYYMYDDLTYDGDLNRFLVIADSKDELDLENYKILDSYKNLYLYTFKDSKIRSDNVKYEILPKFRIE